MRLRHFHGENKRTYEKRKQPTHTKIMPNNTSQL